MSIGSRIKIAHNNLKITQEQLAKMIGVTKGTIENYENELSTPKIELMFKLINVLNCDANYLYQNEINFSYHNSNIIFNLNIDEKNHLKTYLSLNAHEKEKVEHDKLEYEKLNNNSLKNVDNSNLQPLCRVSIYYIYFLNIK